MLQPPLPILGLALHSFLFAFILFIYSRKTAAATIARCGRAVAESAAVLHPSPLHANSITLQLFHPTPVGLFPRGNTPGTCIADQYGNVWEWVDEDVTRKGEIERKATRGASSRTNASDPNGRWDSRSTGHNNIGFRCARRR